MFVCLYTYRCVRVYKYISTGSYVYICIRVHGYTCMHMHSFIHLCIYMYINVYMRLQYFICVFDNFALKVYVWDYSIICVEYYILHIHMGWLRLVSSLRLWVSSAEYSLLYRALLQKRPLCTVIHIHTRMYLSSAFRLCVTYHIQIHADVFRQCIQNIRKCTQAYLPIT